MTIIDVNFNGACEPCPAGVVPTYGWVIRIDKNPAITGSGVLASSLPMTNNTAEYCAIGFALRHLIDHCEEYLTKGTKIRLCGSSQLAVNQVLKKWQCNEPHLQKLRDRCCELLAMLEERGVAVDVSWIPKEKNDAARQLSRSAYREHTGTS